MTFLYQNSNVDIKDDCKEQTLKSSTFWFSVYYEILHIKRIVILNPYWFRDFFHRYF